MSTRGAGLRSRRSNKPATSAVVRTAAARLAASSCRVWRAKVGTSPAWAGGTSGTGTKTGCADGEECGDEAAHFGRDEGHAVVRQQTLGEERAAHEQRLCKQLGIGNRARSAVVLDGDHAARCPRGCDERGRNRLFGDHDRASGSTTSRRTSPAISATVRMWVSEFSGTAMLK